MMMVVVVVVRLVQFTVCVLVVARSHERDATAIIIIIRLPDFCHSLSCLFKCWIDYNESIYFDGIELCCFCIYLVVLCVAMMVAAYSIYNTSRSKPPSLFVCSRVPVCVGLVLVVFFFASAAAPICTAADQSQTKINSCPLSTRRFNVSDR